MSKSAHHLPPQPRAVEMSLANYNRTQAAIARFRLYPLTVLYTVFAILMVMIGFWAAHPWTTVAFFSAGCLIWTCIEYLVHRFVLHRRFPPGNGVILRFLQVRPDPLHWDHPLRPFDRKHISGELKDTLALFFLAGPISAFFPVYTVPVLLAGIVESYVAEQWLHYALHFSDSRFSLFRRMKQYHLYRHSEREIDKGYDITTDSAMVCSTRDSRKLCGVPSERTEFSGTTPQFLDVR